MPKKVVKPERMMGGGGGGENNGVWRVMDEISRVQFEKPIRFQAVCEKNNMRSEGEQTETMDNCP